MFGYLTGFDRDFFDQFERMRREMDALFGAPLSIRSMGVNGFPAINVGISPKQVDVYVFAAGLDPEKLEVNLQQNLLTLAGERKVEVPEGSQVYRQERFSGRFRRTLSLPEDVDPDRVNANYRDGVLHISIQRKEELQPRKIEVK